MSPNDWHLAYVASKSHVFQFNQTTQKWTDITGSLPLSTIRGLDVMAA